LHDISREKRFVVEDLLDRLDVTDGRRGAVLVVIDNDAGDGPRSERDDDARPNGRGTAVETVCQQVEARNWNSDADQQSSGFSGWR